MHELLKQEPVKLVSQISTEIHTEGQGSLGGSNLFHGCCGIVELWGFYPTEKFNKFPLEQRRLYMAWRIRSELDRWQRKACVATLIKRQKPYMDEILQSLGFVPQKGLINPGTKNEITLYLMLE